MKLKKKIPLIDQHDRYGFWGGKFGGSLRNVSAAELGLFGLPRDPGQITIPRGSGPIPL